MSFLKTFSVEAIVLRQRRLTVHIKGVPSPDFSRRLLAHVRFASVAVCVLAGPFAVNANAVPLAPPYPAPVAAPPAAKTSAETLDASPRFTPCTRTQTVYGGRAAFRLTDGKTEALIVPAISRVMFYGFVGGENQLWNAPPPATGIGGWRNYGGDKTWAAPQDNWAVIAGRNWPPDEAWDGSPYTVELLPNGALRTISPPSLASGTRCIREYGFDAAGRFLVSQVFEKVSGNPVTLGIWSVTQVPHPAAVYVRCNADSPYTGGAFIFRNGGKAPLVDIKAAGDDLLRVLPSTANSFKVGLDSPVSGIVSLRAGVAFVLRADRPDGSYPDGASNAGFPVEIYSNPQPAYSELELLSPLQTYRVGTRFRHTVTWQLLHIPDQDATSPAILQLAVTQLQDTPTTSAVGKQ